MIGGWATYSALQKFLPGLHFGCHLHSVAVPLSLLSIHSLVSVVDFECSLSCVKGCMGVDLV